MSINKLIIIFGIILVIFAGVVFFQFSSKTTKKTPAKHVTTSTTTTNAANTVTINNHTFKIETAKSSKEQQAGLSGRNSLPADHGMLFVFDKTDYYNFWMKNMKFPLDIIFIKDDKIISIEKNATPPSGESNPPIIKSGGDVNKVLEINAGLSDKYNIKKGDNLEINL